MSRSLCLTIGLLLAQGPTFADTGFLDRSVTVGNKTYRYQVYVPADHSAKKTWPAVVFLHGNGAQGLDGLLPTARGMADYIRLNRSRFPSLAVFPQAETGKRWLDGDMEELVIAELDRTMAEFNGDPSRVYLTGFQWEPQARTESPIAGRLDSPQLSRSPVASTRRTPKRIPIGINKRIGQRILSSPPRILLPHSPSASASYRSESSTAMPTRPCQ
jgi:hypothetical protein